MRKNGGDSKLNEIDQMEFEREREREERKEGGGLLSDDKTRRQSVNFLPFVEKTSLVIKRLLT